MVDRPDAEQLSAAVYIVNKHAKTATDNEFLYQLKRDALERMIRDGIAEKKGLQYVPNPRYSKQKSAVLITCGAFHFHLPPAREDMAGLPHLGATDPEFRNPKVQMGLRAAKQLLLAYTDLGESEPVRRETTAGKSRNKDKPGTSGKPRNSRPATKHRSWFDQ